LGVRKGEVGLGAVIAVLMLALPAGADSRRVAIVVGNNAGNSDLPPLRYAESDAGKFARVMVELGDVSADDVMLLQGRKVAELERAIQDAKDRVASFKRVPDTRTVLIFYFSGHSDGEAIELGGEKLPYARLKAMLLGSGADLRVAIVDACRSGAGFREKGAKSTDPFVIKLTDTLVASGDAFITSSAADESALESNEVMGSYFTHNFISGLRGAADTSGDKLITLAEAYRYAYDRTVSATSVLPVGVQHPSYDFRLSGQGELVLSSLVKPSATLVVPDGSERSMITDVVRDQVVVELPKGPIREVALSPGQYGLRLIKGGISYGGRINLSDGMRRIVRWDELTPQTSGVIVAKKGDSGPEYEVTAPVPGTAQTRSPVFLSLAAGIATTAAVQGVSTGLRLGLEPTSRSGFTFSLMGSWGQDTIQTEYDLQLRVGYRFSVDVWRFWFAIGPEVGVAVFLQQAGMDPLAVAGTGVVSARGTARLNLTGPLWLTLDADIGVGLVRFDNKQYSVVPLPTFLVGVALAL
jgi:hypothetical protein